MLLEAKFGSEQHSSSWGKFIVKGFTVVADNRVRTNHESYTEGATDVPAGTIFTVWAAHGDKHGTSDADFYICVVDSDAEPQEITGGHSSGGCYIRGQFRILARGDGPVRAPRLLQWSQLQPLTAAWAEHLGRQIKLRGKAQPDPLPA